MKVTVKTDENRTEIMNNIMAVKFELFKGCLELKVIARSGGNYTYCQAPDFVLIEEVNDGKSCESC